MTERDYREIRKGDMLRHQRLWSWGTVTGFAPNGMPRVRLINGQYRIFPHESVVCHLYDYDAHVRQWRTSISYRELAAFQKRIGKRRFARLATLVLRQAT